MATDSDDMAMEISQRFHLPEGEIGTVVSNELQSILRIHRLTPEDLSFKWESYCMKMGAETQLGLKTVRDFKKDLQDVLEQQSRAKTATKSNDKRGVHATPRAAMGKADMYGMLDGLVPTTPHTGASQNGANGSTAKRKNNFATPAAKSSRSNIMSSPSLGKSPSDQISNFADRKDPGAIQETLNSQIELPAAAQTTPSEARIKLKSNTDMPKFGYKTMAMKLSDASEILDDRIELFAKLVRDHHNLEDVAFGNPASQSHNEFVAVGRIASDSAEGKLNTASLVLETSRIHGNGLRVPLNVEKLSSYHFFPGQIVALRGSNVSGKYFVATEILNIPAQLFTTSQIDAVDAINSRIFSEEHETRPLVTLVASGPYTTDLDLDFSPFAALLSAAEESQADALVLLGPFIDAEHPQIRNGDFDLPDAYPAEPDQVTVTDMFKAYISSPLTELTQLLPGISIVLCPSVRDAVSKHAAWPQDRLVKRDLALPRQASIVTNPMLLSMNENLFSFSSLDVIDQIRSSEIVGGRAKQSNVLERACRQVLEQRHFFPVFPAVEPKTIEDTENGTSFTPLGPSLDVGYLKLGEFVGARPDVLITPSVLPSFAKVIEGVLSINPGSLSKKRGPGTYARMITKPLEATPEEREQGNPIRHKLYERCRVDIVKI